MHLGLENNVQVKILIRLIDYWKMGEGQKGRYTAQKACDLDGHLFPNGFFNRRIGMGFGKLKKKNFLFRQSLLFVLPKEEECEK